MDVSGTRHVTSQPSGEMAAKRPRFTSGPSPRSSVRAVQAAGGTLAQPLRISDSDRNLLGSLLTTGLCAHKECAFHCVQKPLFMSGEFCWIPALGGDIGYGLLLTRTHHHSFADYYRSRTSLSEGAAWIEACRLLTQQALGMRAIVAEHGGAAGDEKGCSCAPWLQASAWEVLVLSSSWM